MYTRFSLLIAFLLALSLAAAPVAAQESNEAQGEPTHNAPLFEPPDLPMPNDYRAGSGHPGDEYWQQRADYRIDVTLDPAEHRLSGTETISYTNNASQALEHLWIQLDQNLFDPESRGARITPPDERFSGAFEGGGFEISNVRLVRDGEATEAEYLIDDTRMRIALDEPLEAEGGQLEIELDFAFTIPEYGADRMGRLDVEKGTVYELAQWYPRMYVFDDVSGWNVMPYLGQGEYYLEYGDFEVNITVPREMIVAATGELQNPEEVLTDEQRERLEQARGSDETVMIIDREEAGSPAARPSGSGELTWSYRAEDVRDFSWAASEAFIWDAARTESGDETALAQSFYPEEGIGTENNPGWERSTEFVKHSIEHYSEMWFPYPYPNAINVAGVVGGMEYPQIVFCSVEARGPALFGVTDHEFGHMWFPMVVGSDERRHAWMDEGLNTFINHYSTMEFYEQAPEEARQALISHTTERMLATDQPIATFADRIRREGLGFLAYRKPAAGLLLLREYVLGEERFDSAFQEYVERWAYKHPQPADFFRTIEDVAGEDLDWFWRGWFYSNDRLDPALANIEASSETTRVTVEHRGDLVMPLELGITYEDEETERVRVPVEAFFTEDQFTVVLDEGSVERVELDPRGYLPDVDPANSVWTEQEGLQEAPTPSR